MTEDSLKRLVKKLSSDEKEDRDEGLKVLFEKVEKFLDSDQVDLIWEGLFYCMWYTDKLFVQQQLSKKIASLLDCVSDYESKTVLFSGFILVMQKKWHIVDQHRVDKYFHLFKYMCANYYGWLFSVENEIYEKDSGVDIFKAVLQCLNEMFAVEKNASDYIGCFPFALQSYFTDIFYEVMKENKKLIFASEKHILFINLFLDQIVSSIMNINSIKKNKQSKKLALVFVELMGEVFKLMSVNVKKAAAKHIEAFVGSFEPTTIPSHAQKTKIIKSMIDSILL